MELAIEDYLEEKYNRSFNVTKKSDNIFEIKFTYDFENYTVKYLYNLTNTFDYNMKYLKNQIDRIIKKESDKNDA